MLDRRQVQASYTFYVGLRLVQCCEVHIFVFVIFYYTILLSAKVIMYISWKGRIMIPGAKEKRAVWAYSTHLNEQRSPGQCMPRNQCGLVLHLTGYSDNTAVYIKRRPVWIMYVCLPFPCVCCDCLVSRLSRYDTYVSKKVKSKAIPVTGREGP
jgi:hypothetical protein